MGIVNKSLVRRWTLYQILALSLIMVLYSASVSVTIGDHFRDDVANNARRVLVMVADIVAGRPDLFNEGGLEFVTRAMAARIPWVDHRIIVDHTLKVVSDSRGLNIGGRTDQTRMYEAIREGREQTFRIVKEGRPQLRLTLPIFGAYDEGRRSNVIGAVAATLRLDPAEEAIWAAQAGTAAFLAGLFLAYIAFQYAGLRRSLRPFNRLVAEVNAFRRGEKTVFSHTGMREFDILGDALEGLRLKAQEQAVKRENIEAALLESNRARQEAQNNLELQVRERTADLATSRTRMQHLLAASPAIIYSAEAAGEETQGILYLRAPAEDSGADISPETVALIQTTGEQVSLSLSNLRLREDLRNQSIRDSLTGLFNRRYLDETLAQETIRARRSGEPLSVIMLDIDYFKEFNDEFGHEAGDLVLQTLGAFLRQSVRGGEEFTIILPGASPEAALVRAEKLRTGILAQKFRYNNRDLGDVTISLGVASCPLHGETGEEVIVAADRALYRAKEIGRNRVLKAEM